MVEILLIRHGETAWNAERRMQGHLDIGLNADGLHQAAALARALQDEPIDAIYSSDLQRALQTAQAVAGPRGMPIGLEPGLRERCYGIFEGLLYGELAQVHPHAYEQWQRRDLDARYPSGVHQAETLREFSARSVDAIDRLAAAGNHRRIALFTHGGVLECAYRAATGTSIQQARDFEILNASINRLHWNAGQLRLVDWADVGHLARFDAGALDEIIR